VFEDFDDFWRPVEAGGSRASAAYLARPEADRVRVQEDARRRPAGFEVDGRLVLDVGASGPAPPSARPRFPTPRPSTRSSAR
jgi:hypothetical protein